MSQSEFFPPTVEELMAMILEVEKQLEECEDSEEGVRLSYEKMKLERKLKKAQESTPEN